MTIPTIDSVTTREQAQNLAIEWTIWTGTEPISYKEMSDWQSFFREVARKFNLRNEFEENGII